ncbi:MAG: RNB domain-containing ribonuclease [Bacilli bacterium]|nr:RNB domain-containing ribonuclease [Bacilli bacterium]
MNLLKDKLSKFFETYKNKISVKKLISIFKISEKDYPIFLEILYQLEKEGKILGDSNGYYIHKPDDFYLQEGVVHKSSKNRFYLNLGNGLIINIPNKKLNGANENDIVFVSVSKSEKHNKQKIGDVVRVVTPPKTPESTSFYKAKIRKNYSKNFYYVELDNNIIYIPDKDLNGAYPHDIVNVQINDNKYGKVINILERKNNQHVFEYKEINGEKRFTPIGTFDFKIDLEINDEETFEIGDRILADLSLDNKATYVKKIKNENNLDSYVRALFYDFGFTYDFSEKTKEEVKHISQNLDEKEISEREDLRNLTTFTIDGEKAKDLDDAISLEFKNGKYYLYVHIADVSYYVKEGSAVFKDAYLRGTSVYPANGVFAMIPKELSNGVCSLNPNEDKLTKTCKIEIDEDGNILDFNVFNSVIKSNYKMSYEKVNDILNGKNIDEEYKPYVDNLNKLNELSSLLQKKKLERGFLCFECETMDFYINENGNVESMTNHKRGPAELMIENFMLITNELVTSLAFYCNLPFMYRNHEGPTVDQINKLKSDLNGFKKIINTIKNITNPKVLQKILLSICKGKDTLEAMYFSKVILKCMNRAYYDVDNIGHYALALEYYGTFTSPIRRFPDLLNHIIIDKIIRGDLEDIELYYQKYKDMCEHCNEMQKAAERFEQHVDEILLKDFVSNYIGMTLDAKIMFISHHVLCIKTSNQLYGYIDLPKSSFESNKAIINGIPYETGDKIKVSLDGIKQNSDELLFSIKENKKVLCKKRKKEIK